MGPKHKWGSSTKASTASGVDTGRVTEMPNRLSQQDQVSSGRVNKFIRLEENASRDIVVDRAYAWLVGDLASGIVLSQIVSCWSGTADSTRLERGGMLWLCKRRADWADLCCLMPKQFDRAVERLKEMELIDTAVFRFNGAPTKHISLNLTRLTQRLSDRNLGDCRRVTGRPGA